MPTELEELDPPKVGAGIEFGRQVFAPYSNNRIISRRFKMRIEDQADYTVPLINPTLYDSFITTAVIVDQRILPMAGNRTDCLLLRTFAEVPTEWDDYAEEVVTFPGVKAGPFFAGGDFAFRTQPLTLPVPVRVRRKYYLSNPQRIEIEKELRPIDELGNAVNVLNDKSTPNSDYYIALAKSGQEFIWRCRRRQWKGDIWVRETVFARAQ